MNIQPVQNNVSMQANPNSYWKRIKNKVAQKVLDATPKTTVKESVKQVHNWERIDDIVSHPAYNRGIMGVTALITQPAIDACNHKVDEETRTVSRFRTMAKIIAGTLVGMCVVRGPLYKTVKNMTDIGGKSRFSKALLPKKHLSEIAENPKFLKNYRSALSMVMALVAMCITNFALDAPLTIFLTNLFNEKHKERMAKNEQ